MLIELDRMPDVAQNKKSPVLSPIDWVGMENIDVPLLIQGREIMAKAGLFVDVSDPSAKGIHMSRLYLALEKYIGSQPLDLPLVEKAMVQFIKSQSGLSNRARLELRWDHPLKRPALLTDNEGWKTYPTCWTFKAVGEKVESLLEFTVLYSSTCPCSAALSRQLLEREFRKAFDQKNLEIEDVSRWLRENSVATPHSQRSSAQVFLKGLPLVEMENVINLIENCLKTPVQTAVKREDEQEFARLNGVNLMFVEDSLRRLKKHLSSVAVIEDFSIKVSHYESLHAHDAVGWISKSGRTTPLMI